MADTVPTYSKSYQSIFVASQNENGQVAQEDQIEQNDSSVKLKPKQHLPARTANTAKPESNPASDWSEERSGQGEGSGVQSGADSVGNGDLNSAVWGVAREERASSDWSGWRDADAEGVFGDRVACSAVHLAGSNIGRVTGSYRKLETSILAATRSNWLMLPPASSLRHDYFCVTHFDHRTVE
ncbi:hypothetical protein BLNAU_24794 [Blattamonas nauphoetae]|uniref:Uncharacterized protein n=1 Tax=Blattamonas nauphoetae TaxID=2049346 RepID=A0ABQ9WLU1_9EUKA|nr:hypothetical protein BLNAU_24794 [Blattamonas nauphoetae]